MNYFINYLLILTISINLIQIESYIEMSESSVLNINYNLINLKENDEHKYYFYMKNNLFDNFIDMRTVLFESVSEENATIVEKDLIVNLMQVNGFRIEIKKFIVFNDHDHQVNLQVYLGFVHWAFEGKHYLQLLPFLKSPLKLRQV